MRADLLVVGAGPAGCAAAVAARRRAPALRVVVVDAARFPRDKPCAGAIPGGGLAEMERAGLSLRVPCAWAGHAVVRVEGSAQRVRLPRPAALVSRRAWDADLVAQVRAAGAEVIEGAALSALRLGRGGGVARAGAHRIAFRLAVAADGVAGASRRLLGLPTGRRAPLREVAAPGRGRGELVFDLDAGLPGYAWHFSGEGAAAGSAGVYSLEPAADLSGRLDRWLGGAGEAPEGGHGGARAWAIRLFDPAAPAHAGPVLLAGEALGVDPLAGEGIRYALWSGRVAGELSAWALSRRALAPLPALLGRLYRLRLAASRSGVALELAARLAPRLYASPEGGRFRRYAADRAVAEALAAVVSGARPVAAIARLAVRYRALDRRGPDVAGPWERA